MANPLANVVQKKLTQQTADPLFITGITYTGLLLACLPFIALADYASLPNVFWQNALAMGILAVLGNALLVKALRTGDLSVLGPVNAYKSVVSILFGVMLLGEIPSRMGLLGVGLIVVGSYFVLNTKAGTSPSGTLNRPEIWWRVLALVCSAIEAVFIKKAVLLSSATVVFVVWCGLGCMLSWVWYGLFFRKNWTPQVRLLRQQGMRYVALIALVGLMQLATTVAFTGVQVGYALALFQTSAVVSVLFGYQFFQERNLAPKLIGATIMVAGAALIVLFK